ncbi:right-handed parallel beta-helix repeat-containing protein [Candidatus Uabimicrobium amorphum]|uniref:Right handed beta helix domain-containing protein n=1 Tax=Uabimicrobium amorphum TaxID=2596890 RepID=A0A5S9F6T8_UABAM|nr:right-handed parallel beta-helix repeat-containing protein [Candidatus Uabimicrobium amorphum]BBM87039.1 hypothetical protein UABAM_05441 [Candidatus Uabimicrobium amorphum]
MKIKQTPRKQPPRVTKTPRKKLRMACFFLVFVGVFVVGFFCGIKYRNALVGELSVRGFTKRSNSFTLGAKNFLRTLPKVPQRYLKASPAQKIYLNIKFKHLSKLQKKRSEALSIGHLTKTDDDYVPAEVIINGETLAVKLRLKGDDLDHLRGNKISLRVKVRDGKHIFGMRRFSLQAPHTKGYQAEALIHDHMRLEGIIAPRYFFVDTYINGSRMGIMAVEEHFSKEIQEFHGRRESVILCFDESLMWQSTNANASAGVFENYTTATLRAFHPSRIEKSPQLQRNLQTAIGLMRGFLEGKLRAEDVFDIELFAKFFAISEIWNTLHGLRWNNMRFYYNPITAKMEPVSFDVNANYVEDNSLLVLQHRFATLPRHMMQSPKMKEAYVRNLHKVIQRLVEGETISTLRKNEQGYLQILFGDTPLLGSFSFSNLVKRARTLSQITVDNYATYVPKMVFSQFNYPQIVHAYLVKEPTKHIEIHNVSDVPIEVVDIKAQKAVSCSLPMVIAASPFGQKLQYHCVDYDFAAQEKIEITVRLQGNEKLHKTVALHYAGVQNSHPISPQPLMQILRENSFLFWDKNRRCVVVKKGEWRVEKYIVFPQGIQVRIQSGCKLYFAEKAGLLIRGALLANGEAQNPIFLQAVKNTWCGITVLEANESSQLTHVHIHNTSGHLLPHWSITGAITFYKSDVQIKNCTIAHNSCEDALNIIHSQFLLENVHIHDTISDAFDADFAEGIVKGCEFFQIAGDAVDSSGSKIKIYNTTIRDIKDKALSFGERSKVEARNIHILRSGTGVAVKDNSYLEILQAKFTDIKHAALMAYIKKNEFGPAEIHATDVEIIGKKNIIAQTQSTIVLNKKVIETQDIDIDKIYKDGYMKKKR